MQRHHPFYFLDRLLLHCILLSGIFFFIRFRQPGLGQANKCEIMVKVTQVILKVAKVLRNTSDVDMAHRKWICDRLDNTFCIHFSIFWIEFVFIIIQAIVCYFEISLIKVICVWVNIRNKKCLIVTFGYFTMDGIFFDSGSLFFLFHNDLIHNSSSEWTLVPLQCN